jgi:hypothetical protein
MVATVDSVAALGTSPVARIIGHQEETVIQATEEFHVSELTGFSCGTNNIISSRGVYPD